MIDFLVCDKEFGVNLQQRRAGEGRPVLDCLNHGITARICPEREPLDPYGGRYLAVDVQLWTRAPQRISIGNVGYCYRQYTGCRRARRMAQEATISQEI
jgi:hypothetical protein